MSTDMRSPQDAISADGFFKVDDADIGEHVQQMDEDSVPLASQRGLNFYNANVLRHPIIRPVVESVFERSALGVYRSFGHAPAIYSFNSDPQAPVEILIVMLWSKGSRVQFWPRSHHHWLNPVEAANSLLRIPEVRLQHLNLEPKEEELEHGGFTVHDARVAFHIHEGIAISFAFGTSRVVESWTPMRLSRSLERVVRELQSPSIGINVSYLEDVEERAE